jgi:hypothetical protein
MPCDAPHLGKIYFDTEVGDPAGQLPCVCIYWQDEYLWVPFDNWLGRCDPPWTAVKR